MGDIHKASFKSNILRYVTWSLLYARFLFKTCKEELSIFPWNASDMFLLILSKNLHSCCWCSFEMEQMQLFFSPPNKNYRLLLLCLLIRGLIMYEGALYFFVFFKVVVVLENSFLTNEKSVLTDRHLASGKFENGTTSFIHLCRHNGC